MTEEAKVEESREPEASEAEEVGLGDALIGGSTLCQRCGYDTRNQLDIEIDDKEREKYLRCVLGKKSYVKTEKVFDNMVIMHFRNLSPRKSDGMNGIINALLKEDIPEMDKMIWSSRIQFMYHCMKLDLDNREVIIQGEKFQSLNKLEEFKEYFYEILDENFPVEFVSGLLRKSSDFQQYLGKLIAETFSSDF